jgi:TPP-dependent pyruvate/acetoin dehydrogenase alpha subunit
MGTCKALTPGGRARYADGMAIASVRTAEAAGGMEEAAALGLDRDALMGILHALVLTRRLDERGHVLFKQGKLPGSFYTCKGNEGASVGVAAAMAPEDVAAPLHRNLGLHLYRGVEPWRVLCQYMGRVGGTTNGRDSNLRTQDVTPGTGIFAGPSHLPSILPVAVGAALAFRVRGEPRVALGWLGDGSSAHGTAHESMNFAGVRRLPVVFVIDNNQFAYSTPTFLNFASSSLAARGPAYGFEGVVVDGTDVLAVYREAHAAIERARSGGGPTVLELMTLRMEGHAVHDDAAYVPPEMFERWAEQDPVRRFEAWMRTHAELSDDELATLEHEVEDAIAAAVTRAEASPWPDPDTLEDGVYAG